MQVVYSVLSVNDRLAADDAVSILLVSLTIELLGTLLNTTVVWNVMPSSDKYPLMRATRGQVSGVNMVCERSDLE